ncbi:aminotransferase class I/II-fold pyridoxal phosphate-dependent enzyme [Acetobacter estunensis]|uniref:aminotransferase class I/II-fold pyridoxal phosphate-dependent enzyme n=1 Tax=Acetobacter estunensis TaxID=104097 RepID=UPI001C2D184B|nr:aminotransferase class I/II-fold pyridoxal phosphate-dependent enzyme [Acetobacter estunensis]MBV1837600.1 aminotransferase class I/II-fold pyridoxal phosphate-dependent enzyme [Acetobacter estunensis]
MPHIISRLYSENPVTSEYSRRTFGQLAGLFSVGASFSNLVPSARAQTSSSPTGTVLLDKNEYWTGPFPQAVQVAQQEILQGNRYDPGHVHEAFLKTVAVTERVPLDHVLVWQGSMDPLIRSVASFASPQRGLVTVDPTFEVPWAVAKYLNIPVQRVPLTAEGRYVTSARSLLTANPQAGLYYICSPNNPTGTPTSLDEIRWLLEHKPADAIVLVDEAYIHFSDNPSALSLLKDRKDLLILRTFSKLFGMAGLRVGLSFAHPELHHRMMRYDGETATKLINVAALAGARESLLLPEEVRRRREDMTSVRREVEAHLTHRHIAFVPGSVANMIMVDWSHPAKDVAAAFAKEGVIIGRNWPIWPNVSRITLGSREEMQVFLRQVDRLFPA